MVDKTSFGYKIRCMRKFRGYSQDELADIVGISTSTLARYEKDKTIPECDVVVRLVIILGISSDMLLFNPKPPLPNLFTDGIKIPKEESDRQVRNTINNL